MKCCRADSDLAAEHDADRRHPELRKVEPEHVGVLLVIGVERKAPVERRLTIFAYTAEPNSPSHDALNLLASWTSTPDLVSAVAEEEA